jgi:hypothetical protein
MTFKRFGYTAVAAAAAMVLSGAVLAADTDLRNAASRATLRPSLNPTLVAPGGVAGSASTSCYICKKCGDNVGNDPNCKKACDKCSIAAVQPSGVD